MKDKIRELVERQSTDDISYVLEVEGEEIKHQEDKVFRSASIVKLPLCIAALNKVEATQSNPFVKVKDKVSGSGVLRSLNNIEQVTIKDLVVLALIVSDNTASNLLMDYVGFNRLAELFEKWDLKNTAIKRHFMDTSGDMSQMYNVTTAEDMMKTINMIYVGSSHISSGVRKEMKQHLRNQQFNDRVGGALDDGGDEDDIKVSNKTGTLIKLEHDVGVLQSESTGRTAKFSVLSTNWQSNLEANYFMNGLGEVLIEEIR